MDTLESYSLIYSISGLVNIMDVYGRRSRKGIPVAATIALMLVAAIAAGSLAFLWQASALKKVYTLNDELNNEISGLKQENSSLKEQFSEMEEKLKAAESKVRQESAEGKREALQNLSDGLLHLIKDKDMAKLAEFVHPEKGVRFTPYSYVEVNKDIRLTPAELTALANSTEKRIWGAYDGIGDPINLTFNEYLDKFIYDVDFLEAPQIILNQKIQRGNAILNVDEAYPGASFIEYHYPGIEAKYEGMDWRSLHLVFEEYNGKWYLVGIIHGQWTI